MYVRIYIYIYIYIHTHTHTHITLSNTTKLCSCLSDIRVKAILQLNSHLSFMFKLENEDQLVALKHSSISSLCNRLWPQHWKQQYFFQCVHKQSNVSPHTQTYTYTVYAQKSVLQCLHEAWTLHENVAKPSR